MKELKENYNQYKGEIEIIIKNKNGDILEIITQPNIVKIFAKECISHRIHHNKIWDPDSAAWISAGDFDNFAVKYILLGASFDENGVPLNVDDTRFYTIDSTTQLATPVKLGPGASDSGDLINPIPIAEPDRPLKKIESITYTSTYQPAGNPLLQDDVRAINNIVILQTTLKTDEYNGFGYTDSDLFTITEIGLAAGREINTVGDCECTPRKLFLEGNTTTGLALTATANGTSTITLDSSEDDVDLIKEGDQILLTSSGASPISEGTDDLEQVSQFYLVVSKLTGGRDIQLDRIPTDVNGDYITGEIGVFKDTLRIFSHRVLNAPIRKTSDVEITIKWKIIFN